MTENDRLTHKRMGMGTGWWTAASKAELMARLAEYEETGLAPDQVRALANGAYLEQRQRSALADRLCRWLAACIPVDKDSPCSGCDYFGRCEDMDTVRVPVAAMEDLRKYLGGGDQRGTD